MLNAIVNGKAGNTKEDIKAGTSWRVAFQGREDILTASVFERLAYLPGPLLYKLLGKIFNFKTCNDDTVELHSFEFWPRWSKPESDIGFVEPDAFLAFSNSEHENYTHFILEAKPHDTGGQYLEQWQSQCSAYTLEVSGINRAPRKTIFLAIGGLGYQAEKFAKITNEISKTFNDISFRGASWTSLVNEVKEMHANHEKFHIKLLLEDVLSALSLAGYQEIVPMQTLISPHSFSDSYDKTALILNNFNRKCLDG